MASSAKTLDTGDSDSFLRELADTGGDTVLPELVPGEHVDRFVVHGVIGRGGMGVVYRAEDEELRRTVALKVLNGQHGARRDRQKRFLREAKAAAAVTHPNVARILEVGEHAKGTYLVFEYVDGCTLRSRIREGALPFSEVSRIGQELARGLAAAHAAGIVHRDMKPENVLLDASGTVKILDFGLAKWESVKTKTPLVSDVVTAEGHVLGSPGYMSPEQALGKPMGPATDTFSLGIVLFELATGERPFRGDTPMEAIVSATRDAVPDPRNRQKGLPRAFARLVRRCLDKAPEKRPSAEDIANELARMPRDEGTTRRRVATFGVGMFAMVGLVAILGFRYGKPVKASEPTVSAAAPPIQPEAPRAAVVVQKASEAVPEPASKPSASLAKGPVHEAPAARATLEKPAPAPSDVAPAPKPSASVRPTDSPSFRERK